MPDVLWRGSTQIVARAYVCAFCGVEVAPNEGYISQIQGLPQPYATISICHRCSNPTFFSVNNEQYPGSPSGRKVDGVSDQDVEKLYEEARRCTSLDFHGKLFA